MTTPTTFYTVDRYVADQSIGFLMRQMVKSFKIDRDRRLAGHGYTDEHWVPMFKLQREGRCTLTALVTELGLDSAAMSKTLAYLQERGVVAADTTATETTYALTPQGEALGGVVQQALVDVANGHLAGFTQAEFDQLVALLQKMYGNALVA